MVLVVVLFRVVAGGVVGVEHVDEFVGAAEWRNGVEGAFVLVDLGEDERLQVEVLEFVVCFVEVKG